MNQSGPRPSDRFIPLYIALFFIVQFGMFGWFYHVASASYTGVVTDEAYEKGLRYNQTIAKAEEQAKLGWAATILQKDGSIQLMLKDSDQKPVTGANVSLWLIRPVQAGTDQQSSMKEVSLGVYNAPAVVPEKGLWEVRIKASKDGQSYQSSRRLEF
jgi:nitrogen fixation protein FixH